MTERNRVTPLGDLVALPIRGAWTGNRGCLHEGREIVRYSRGDLWIVCALEFRGRHSELYRRGRFTWLFFVDEAQALAAGHRPCGECRHAAYDAYADGWAAVLGGARPSAGEMNRRLQRERVVPRTHERVRHPLPWRDLPDGVFVQEDDGTPAVLLGDALVPWRIDRYGAARPRPRSGTAAVLTPPASVAVLRSGYPVQMDPAVRTAAGL